MYVNAWLNTLPDTKISYLWKNVPEQLLFELGFITNYNEHRLQRKKAKYNKNHNIDDEEPVNPLQDIGIDIIRIKKKIKKF